ALDGGTLLRQEARRRQRVLHFLERDEHALAVRGDAFFERRARSAQVRLVATSLENRQRDARADAPDPALQVEEIVELGALDACVAGEAHAREERRLGDADAGIARGELS